MLWSSNSGMQFIQKQEQKHQYMFYIDKKSASCYSFFWLYSHPNILFQVPLIFAEQLGAIGSLQRIRMAAEVHGEHKLFVSHQLHLSMPVAECYARVFRPQCFCPLRLTAEDCVVIATYSGSNSFVGSHVVSIYYDDVSYYT